MTRKTIIEEAHKAGFIKGECADVVDFAEAMVWRHNEELDKIEV